MINHVERCLWMDGWNVFHPFSNERVKYSIINRLKSMFKWSRLISIRNSFCSKHFNIAEAVWSPCCRRNFLEQPLHFNHLWYLVFTVFKPLMTILNWHFIYKMEISLTGNIYFCLYLLQGHSSIMLCSFSLACME